MKNWGSIKLRDPVLLGENIVLPRTILQVMNGGKIQTTLNDTKTITSHLGSLFIWFFLFVCCEISH